MGAATEATVNAERADFIAATAGPQSSWRANPDAPGLSRFLQLPPTHDVPPAGLEAPNTNRKPSGRNHGWKALKRRGYVPPALMRASLEVHEYLSPDGPGWYVIQRVLGDDGKIYFRIENGAGPEEERTMSEFALESPLGRAE